MKAYQNVTGYFAHHLPFDQQLLANSFLPSTFTYHFQANMIQFFKDDIFLIIPESNKKIQCPTKRNY